METENQTQTDTQKYIGTWEAWTYPSDFIPHVYVSGKIPTNGERPVVHLIKEDKDSNDKQLYLRLHPDIVNPDGKYSMDVSLYQESLMFKTLESVVIFTDKFNPLAVIPIKRRARQNVGSNGNGEAFSSENTSFMVGTTVRIIERGYSNSYDLKEAIQDAMRKIPARGGDIADYLASYKVVNIGAEVGGIAGFNRLYVDVEG